VLTVHGDELAANTLELRQGHWRRRELNGLLDISHGYLSTPFARVILLVHHYLREDIGGRLVELVEVVLLCRGFLQCVREHLQHVRGTHQHGREVRLDSLHLAIAAYHGVPYLVARRLLVLLNDNEQRTVPSRHAIGFFVAEDKVLKVVVVIAAVGIFIR
jgi:hypothetical protein